MLLLTVSWQVLLESAALPGVSADLAATSDVMPGGRTFIWSTTLSMVT